MLQGFLFGHISPANRLPFVIQGFNTFTGSLPDSIGQWTQLEHFYLSGAVTADTDILPDDNRFWGTLPNSIGQWTRIRNFDVSQDNDNPDTFFTGPLPSLIGQWTDLELMATYNNGFTGTLSDSIGQWSNMFLFNIA